MNTSNPDTLRPDNPNRRFAIELSVVALAIGGIIAGAVGAVELVTSDDPPNLLPDINITGPVVPGIR